MNTETAAPAEADAILNTLGLFCPVPIWRTAQKIIEDMQPGQVLPVLSDDEAIKSDMVAWCRNTRHELLTIVEQDRQYLSYVEKMG